MRTAKPAPPAVKSSLSEQAFGMLEEMIVTLKLPPGSLWSEATLSESLGIGRTPVREAIQRLAEYHLVVIMQRHGIRIAEVNEQEQLLVEWNNTASAYPRDYCIHELFAEQARRTPHAA